MSSQIKVLCGGTENGAQKATKAALASRFRAAMGAHEGGEDDGDEAAESDVEGEEGEAELEEEEEEGAQKLAAVDG